VTSPWYRGRWKGVRKTTLERDHYMCQIQSVGCEQVADTVDHIVSPRLGGSWWDQDNLRAACAHCNYSKQIDRDTIAIARYFSAHPDEANAIRDLRRTQQTMSSDW
jgi:5-methylcytosine-specific restriction endonuclease McrA